MSDRTEVLTLDTPLGPARAHVDAAGAPRATLVLGHGAGGGPGAGARSRDLRALAAALPDRGVTVVRLDQPWLVAGRRLGPAPATLDRAWVAAVPQLPVRGALVLGGRSAGARVACRTATALGAAGVVALAFPLHAPGRPERSRAAELAGAGVPLVVVQGERDAFGRPAEFPEGVDVRPVPGADHGMRVGARATPPQGAVLASVADVVADWVLGRVPGRESRRRP